MPTPEEEFFEAMKIADQTPDDERRSVISEPTELYEDPEDQPSDASIDASIGNRTRAATGVQLAHSVLEAIHDGREKLLNRIFDEKGKSDKTEQTLMSQRLDHVQTGQFETSSPQLAPKSKVKIASMPETLGDLVRQRIGRS